MVPVSGAQGADRIKNLRRLLRLCISVVLAATAVWAAVAGVDALLTWRFELESSGLRPGRIGEDLALAAVALTAAVGIVAMVSRSLSGLTGLGRTPTRSDDPELARLVSEARTDSLTRLANHREFHDRLAAEIERRNTTGSVFSLMAVDLDGLKAVNDTFGHQAGDAHIVRMAQALQTEVGTAGTVFRTGGDEFMILLPDLRNWHAINLAHKIHAATASASAVRALSIGVTESKGTEHRNALIRQADLALYEAKRAKLAAVAYQPGLEPADPQANGEGLSEHLKALASALARTVDVRDCGTSNHSEIVSELAAAIAARQGIDGPQLERIRVAALLHDVGKISVPDVVLHKPGPLAETEQAVMREHVTVGRDLLLAAGFTEEATWVLHHHERYDGQGYPDALRGEDIPLESRIIAVADAFEAMTGERPYRETLTTEQAVAELTALAGTQFDASCVRAVAEIVGGGVPAAPPAWSPADPKQRPIPFSKLKSRTGVR
jgi:diguanylate cyclase (GGDEF)-like protein/putative nucleotidyltransferase with HDIG domain